MSRRTRLLVFLVGGGVLAAAFVVGVLGIPGFGGSEHRYRDLAVPAAVAHRTANAVAAVNFDQRAIDTFGEETILIASTLGAVALLRPSREETVRRPPDLGHTLESTRLIGYVLMPLTLVLGTDVVAHGGITPGGGFQGGVVLATGLHLLYVTGSYPALDRLRPLLPFRTAEALGAAAFGVVGALALIGTGTFLGNALPYGSLGQIFSTGTVQVLNLVVGIEVFGSMVVLLAAFFEQEISVRKQDEEAR